MIRVAIVDDHKILRSGLRHYLNSLEDVEVVAEAANGKEALDIVRSHKIDVLTLDLTMPGFSGFDALASIRARAPHTAILVFSGLPEDRYAVNLIRNGASGYLNKDCAPLDIVAAIRTVAQGKRYLSPVVANLLAEQVMEPNKGLPHEILTSREFQVFLRLAKGESITGIGEGLSLSVKTVTTHRKRALNKMKMNTNSDATYYAIKHHLIE